MADVPITITEPKDGATITTKTWDIKGTAPAGSTVYLMEMMRGFRETEGPGDPEWQYPIWTKAADDGTFVIDQLSNGTGMGDKIEHIMFVNVGGTQDGIKIIGGAESNKVRFYHKPKEE